MKIFTLKYFSITLFNLAMLQRNTYMIVIEMTGF